MTRTKPVRLLIVCTAALVLLAACRTPLLPPGYLPDEDRNLKNVLVSTASPRSVYALMQWYTEAVQEKPPRDEWLQLAQDARRHAMEAIHLAWRSGLIDQTGSLVVADHAAFLRLVPETLADRTDWDTLAGQIKNLKNRLAAPHAIDVPAEECLALAFWNSEPRGKEPFRLWAEQHTALALPDPAGLNRLELIRQLDEIHAAVTLKQTILARIAEAEKRSDSGQFHNAFELLWKLNEELIRNKRSLDPIRDTATLEKLHAALRELPVREIRAKLEIFTARTADITAKIDPKNANIALDASFASLETELSDAFRQWNADPRYKHPLDTLESLRRQALAAAANTRAALWQAQIRTLAAQYCYWDATVKYRTFRDALKQSQHPQLSVYHTLTAQEGNDTPFADVLAGDIREEARQFLPEALRLFAIDATNAANNARPGYAAALACMAEEIIDILRPPHDSVSRNADLDSLRKTARKASDAIRDTVLRRTVAVSDMTASIPGTGITYTRDLIYALNRLFNERRIDHLLTVIAPGDRPAPFAYTLFNGVVADFDGSETVERQTTKIFQRYGDIRKAPNPQRKDSPDAPPFLYSQEVSQQLVTTREIERIAHVRVFLTLRGPGFSSLVEVNDFYKRRFIIQESHPFRDLKLIEVLTNTDMAQLPERSSDITLTYDRVWTQGEILDWARRNSLNIMTLKLLAHFNQFPFHLMNKAKLAEDAGDLAEAAEQRAYCHELARLLPPDKLTTEGLDQTSHAYAQDYEACFKALEEQYKALNSFVLNTKSLMLHAANILFKETRRPANAVGN